MTNEEWAAMVTQAGREGYQRGWEAAVEHITRRVQERRRTDLMALDTELQRFGVISTHTGCGGGSCRHA